MPGQGFSGVAAYNRFRMQPQQGYGYWDTYGAGILPGGTLRASPSNTGQQRSLPGIEFPGTPDPGISNDPIYGNTLGLPGREVVAPGGGGAGEFYGGAIPRGRSPYPYPDMNVPTNEDMAPGLTTNLYIDPVTGTPISSQSPGRTRYPDLSGLPPVYVTPPGGYPIPGLGVGLSSEFGGGQSWRQNAQSWRQNAASNVGRGGGFAGFANQAASNAGFGSGLASMGGGGWQTVSGVPDLGGMSPIQALGGGGFRVYQN